MSRFVRNRGWTIAVALVLSLTSIVYLPSVGRADGGGQYMGDGVAGTPGNPGTPGYGDPDIPINNGKGSARPMVRVRGTLRSSSSVGGVGDTTTSQNVWVFRIRIALQVYRILIVRL
jgi:hypothetical protein